MKQRCAQQEKKLADDAQLLRIWKKARREEREAALAGPHGAVLGELLRMLDNIQHVRPAQLIGFARAIDWTTVDLPTKQTVVHELSVAIITFREKCGLEPFDDPLPGEPDGPFHTIKAIVFTPSPPSEGAHRGEARSEYQSPI